MVKTLEGLWQCTDCGHSTSQPTNLRNHIETHHVGGLGYHCNVCGKYAKTKNALNNHRTRLKHH